MWFNCQGNGKLGRLDPRDGSYKLIDLGPGSAPHGVIVGPDKAAWVTDGGQNAIVRVDNDHKVTVFKLPIKDYANLNTARVRQDRHLLVHRPERLSRPARSEVRRHAGVQVAGRARQLRHDRHAEGRRLVRLARRQPHRQDRPEDRQRHDGRAGDARIRARAACGRTRRAASGSASGTAATSRCTIPADGAWRTWRLPGERPRTYSVYVDEKDKVWLTDFGGNAIVRFDPVTEEFNVVPERQAERQCAPDGRQARPGVGRRIRHQPAGHDRDAPAAGMIRSVPVQRSCSDRFRNRRRRRTTARRCSSRAAPAIRSIPPRR